MMQKIARRMRRARRIGPRAPIGREGFSLVEIMMVLMILSIGVLPLVIIQHRARGEVTESDQFTQGLTVAQTELERIKGMGFGNAAADTGQVDNVTWVAQVSNVSFGLDRVQVTASWRDGNGVSSLTVTDLVSMR